MNTLLHEMIHAFLFVAEHNTDHDDHGPTFLKHAERINTLAGSNVTGACRSTQRPLRTNALSLARAVYHTFHDEVELHQKHWWRCDGPCVSQAPFYGFVKRAMNRAPGPTDKWWAAHASRCGGSFHKVKEPPAKPKSARASANSKAARGSKDIRKLLSPPFAAQSSSCSATTASQQAAQNEPYMSNAQYASSTGAVLGSNALADELSSPAGGASNEAAAALQSALRRSILDAQPARKHFKKSDDFDVGACVRKDSASTDWPAVPEQGLPGVFDAACSGAAFVQTSSGTDDTTDEICIISDSDSYGNHTTRFNFSGAQSPAPTAKANVSASAAALQTYARKPAQIHPHDQVSALAPAQGTCSAGWRREFVASSFVIADAGAASAEAPHSSEDKPVWKVLSFTRLSCASGCWLRLWMLC